MRSRVHMLSMFSALASLSAIASVPAALPVVSSAPRRKGVVMLEPLACDKPPMNGAREVARRQRQMARKAAKDAKS